MKINRFDSVHSANSYQSKPLLQSVSQTKLSAQSVVSDKLSMLSNHIEVGLYLAMTLSDLFTNSDAYFNTVTKRMEENKKKYDKLSALVKPVDVVVDKVAKLAIDHAGDPKFADPTLTPIKIYTVNIDNNVTEYFPFNTPPDPDYPYGRVFETRQTEKIRAAMGMIYYSSRYYGGNIPTAVQDKESRLGIDHNNYINAPTYNEFMHFRGYSCKLDVYDNILGRYVANDKIVCFILPAVRSKGSDLTPWSYCKKRPQQLIIPEKLDQRINLDYIENPPNRIVSALQSRTSTIIPQHRVKLNRYFKYAMRCVTAKILDTSGGIYDIIDQMKNIKKSIKNDADHANFEPTLAVLQRKKIRRTLKETIHIVDDNELQKVIGLVKNLQPSSTLTLAQLKDVSTSLKLSELRSIVNDGKKKMLTLNALKDTDVVEIKKQVGNIQVLSEFFSGIMSAVKAMLGFFIDRMS